jgi:hypothetical protein
MVGASFTLALSLMNAGVKPAPITTVRPLVQDYVTLMRHW